MIFRVRIALLLKFEKYASLNTVQKNNHKVLFFLSSSNFQAFNLSQKALSRGEKYEQFIIYGGYIFNSMNYLK